MLLKKKICPFCGASYDEALESCPQCHALDENYPKEGSKKITWLPILKQLLLFAIGFAGLQITQLIFSLVFRGWTEGAVYSAAVNFSSYILLIIGLLMFLFKDLKYLFKSFTKWYNPLLGLAYGAALIITSAIYANVVAKVFGVGDNANQSAVVSIVTKYPIPSIFILGMVGPVCEELTYRVGLYSFVRRINIVLAFIITFIVFAFIHFNFRAIGTEAIRTELINIPSYAIAGIILCLAYEKNGFAASSIAHVLNNTYSVFAIILAAKISG